MTLNMHRGAAGGAEAAEVEVSSEGGRLREVPTEDLLPSPARSPGGRARGAGAPPGFSENRAAGGLACTFAELGTFFFFQLRVTMFPSGGCPCQGKRTGFEPKNVMLHCQPPTGFPITDELTGVARGCGIKDGRLKPTANFPPSLSRFRAPTACHTCPPPDTLTHTHTHFTQNHSTGEQRVFTQC